MKSPVLLALFGATLLVVPVSGTILINEIHINPPPDLDDNFEFIELRSTTNGVESCAGLTLVIIDNNGATVGEVVEAFNLNGLATGENGLLLLGNNYPSNPRGGPWSAIKAPATTVGDPSGNPPWSGMGNDDLDPNGGLTFLLLTGWTGLTNRTSSSLGDADINDNSILDWLENPPPAGSQTTQPYTTLVDSIGYPDLDYAPIRRPYTLASADLNLRPGSAATFAPDNISRRLSRSATPADQNNAAAWYGGNLAGTAGTALTYDIQTFGDFRGQATPGLPNLDASPVVGNFLINEVSINPPGTDDANFEYVEIVNADGGAASLHGLALVLIRSNNNNGQPPLGTITEAWDLSGFTTGANGLLLLGNNYPDGAHPWGTSVDPATLFADPSAPATQNPVRWSSMGDDDIGSSDGFTLLLVENFTGIVTPPQDLDTNDDGLLDSTPWTAIKDSVGFDQVGGNGKSYALAKITSTPAYDIDNLSRKLGNTTANSAAAWYGGDYGGNSQFSIGFQDDPVRPVIGGFRGAATPGRPNLNAEPQAAAIRINEVNSDPVPDPDGAAEYVELINSSLTIGGMHGLTLVVADGDGSGQIRESIDLSGLSTGPNGLMVLGDGYDTTSPYDNSDSHISPLTAREDPSGLDVNDIGPNSALIVLITKGAKPVVGTSISDIAAGDIVDSIGFGSSPNPAVTLIAPGFTPDHFSRYPGELQPNAAAAWFSGELDPAFGLSSVFYGANFSGTYKGGASPGRYNHAVTPSAATTLLLNEININPPGGDANNEFIEYRAAPSGAISTNGYTLLMLDGTGGNTGTILEAWSLDGLATGTNGLLLTGAGYPALSPWTGTNAPAADTRLASPQFMDPGDIAGDSDNGTVSFLLVRNFSGRVGLDLDAGTGSTNTGADDGNIDPVPRPWSEPIADAAAVQLWDTNLPTPNWSGIIYGGVNLRQSGYTPDNLSRDRNNTTPNAAAAWYGGDIVGSTGTASAFDANQRFPAGVAGMVTAGQPNVGTGLDDAGDEDNDGAVNLVEAALNMNPLVPDADKLPESGTVDVGGTLYPTLSYTRFINGTAAGSVYEANGFRYEMQASLDLVAWTGMSEHVSATSDGNGQTETAVYRPETAYFNTALAGRGTVYLRLRISRL